MANLTSIKCLFKDVLQTSLIAFNEDGDNFNGYIETWENYTKFLDGLLILGIKFVTRTSTVKGHIKENAKLVVPNRGPQILYTNKKGTLPIEFFGQPFTVQKNCLLDCKFGKNYHHKKADHVRQRIRIRSSKKHDCPATMNVKQIWVYTSEKYAVQASNSRFKMDSAQNKALNTLKADLNEKNVFYIERFYIQISSIDVHNHSFSPISDSAQTIHSDSKSIETKRKTLDMLDVHNYSFLPISDSAQTIHSDSKSIETTLDMLDVHNYSFSLSSDSAQTIHSDSKSIETKRKELLDMLDRLKNLIYLCQKDDVMEKTYQSLENTVKLHEANLNVEDGLILESPQQTNPRKRQCIE